MNEEATPANTKFNCLVNTKTTILICPRLKEAAQPKTDVISESVVIFSTDKTMDLQSSTLHYMVPDPQVQSNCNELRREVKFDHSLTSRTDYETRQFLCYMFLFSISFVRWP